MGSPLATSFRREWQFDEKRKQGSGSYMASFGLSLGCIVCASAGLIFSLAL